MMVCGTTIIPRGDEYGHSPVQDAMQDLQRLRKIEMFHDEWAEITKKVLGAKPGRR